MHIGERKAKTKVRGVGCGAPPAATATPVKFTRKWRVGRASGAARTVATPARINWHAWPSQIILATVRGRVARAGVARALPPSTMHVAWPTADGEKLSSPAKPAHRINISPNPTLFHRATCNTYLIYRFQILGDFRGSYPLDNHVATVQFSTGIEPKKLPANDTSVAVKKKNAVPFFGLF